MAEGYIPVKAACKAEYVYLVELRGVHNHRRKAGECINLWGKDNAHEIRK